jgi:hypothetical protein
MIRAGFVTSFGLVISRSDRYALTMTKLNRGGYRCPPEIIQQAIWL